MEDSLWYTPFTQGVLHNHFLSCREVTLANIVKNGHVKWTDEGPGSGMNKVKIKTNTDRRKLGLLRYE